MPVASQVLADPAFRDLTYYRHSDMWLGRGFANDLWGDAKFDYRAGLEFSLVPARDRKTPGDFCVNAVALRMFLPAAQSQARLDAFVRIMSARTQLDAQPLGKRIAAAFASRDKYRPLFTEKGVTVEAGRLEHPNRGEFFLVTLSIPRPE
jgi:hypothetical protein